MTLATRRMNTVLLGWLAAIGAFGAGISTIVVTAMNNRRSRRDSLEQKVEKLQHEGLAYEKDLNFALVKIASLESRMEMMTATHAQAVRTYEDTVINLQNERRELLLVIDEQREEIQILKGM